MALSLPELLQQIRTTADAAARVALCEQALALLKREDNPVVWASLQGGRSASIAQAVEGRYTQEVFDEVLAGYEAALAVFTRDRFADEWASTLRNIGRTHSDAAANALGDPQDHVEKAIGAFSQAAEISPEVAFDAAVGARCDLAAALTTAAAWRGPDALEQAAGLYANVIDVFPKERSPAFWATVHLSLGRLLRAMRGPGDLERAVESLDSALTVFTREQFPRQWLEAHYHRGPALVFCEAGDRNDNLRRALESLRIAASGTSRDEDPETWAALQVTLGQALLDRTDGNPQERIEQAIPVLEAALEVLVPDPASLPWRLAKRFLGESYLRREAGAPEDNVERGISSLEAVAGPVASPGGNVDEWVSDLSNLGQAYAKRRRGDAVQNREKAIAALNAAVSVPLVDDMVPEAWGAAQAWLTLVSMTEPGHQFALKRSEIPEDRARRDDGIEAIAALERGDQQLARELHWHVPFMLEDAVRLLQRELVRFLDAGEIPVRSPEEQLELARARRPLVAQLVQHLDERRVAQQRTEALFEEIRRSGRPFVLYLRGFNNRIARFAEGSVVSGTGNLEWFALTDLVSSIAPMPVVWVANPVESTAIDLMVSGKRPEDMGFRIEAGEDWEQSVRTLASAAAFIVMHNGTMTPGVRAEIAMLQESGRIADTFFRDAPAVGGASRPLDAAAIATLRSWTTRRLPTAPMPAVMCPWVGGERRTALTRELNAVTDLLGRLEHGPQELLADLVLDTRAWICGCATLLERDDLVTDVAPAK